MPSATSHKGKHREVPSQPEPILPLGKQLAHTDKRVRDKAVQDLAAFLSVGGGDVETDGNEISLRNDVGSSNNIGSLTELEMRKLWKGLFYCFWMSDKPLIQQRLAADLASLILAIRPEEPKLDGTDYAMEFIAGFWEAMIREWSGIDRLRIDKFYLLIRRFVENTFRLLVRSNWDEKRINRLESILSAPSGPMSWQDAKVPASLAYHLSDIWLDELDKVLASTESGTVPHAPLAHLLQPFISLLSCTPQSITYNRLTSAVFTPLLTSLTPAESRERPAKRSRKETPEGEQYSNIIANSCTSTAESATPPQLAHSVLKRMMDRASLGVEDGVKEANRRKVYGFVREWGGVDDDE